MTNTTHAAFDNYSCAIIFMHDKFCCISQCDFAGVVVQAVSLRGMISEAGRQAEGLFEAMLNQSFGGEL